jgi:chromosome segregation ATPase
MSDAAVARAIAREAKIWTPFSYSFAFDTAQAEERTIVFGLYSGAYANRHQYLAQIEAAELVNLAADYAAKTAELTAQETALLANIVARRYVANIDRLIHDEKMITRDQAIDLKDETWTVKIAALASDEDALATLVARVTSEQAVLAARLASLDADEAALTTLQVKTEGDQKVYDTRLAAVRAQRDELDTLSAHLNTESAQLASRRASLEADRQVLVTLAARAQSEQDVYDARLASLAADSAALTTLAARVSSETQKTTARISELEAYIEIEGMNLDQVDIDIAEQEIRSSKVDVDVLNAANQALKIQIDTVNAAAGLIDIDYQVAQTNIKIADMNRSIARTDILDADLEIEQERTAAAGHEQDVYTARTEIATKRLTEAGKDIDLQQSLVTHEEAIRTTKEEIMDAVQTRRLAEIEDRKNFRLFDADVKREAADFDYTTAVNDGTTQASIDANRVSVLSMEASGAARINTATVNAAETLATANVATTLQHLIQKS